MSLMNDSSDLLKCSVCEISLSDSNPNYRHYGARNVCQSCASFFRHTVCKGRAYSCDNPRQCQVFKNTPHLLRTACRSCRMEKCRLVGMREALVRSLPYHLLRKSKVSPPSTQENDLQILQLYKTIERIKDEFSGEVAENEELTATNCSKSTEEQSPAERTKRNHLMCVICGQMTIHRHYNAPTCLACRSFFKRSALTLKQYTCQEGDGKCLLRKTGGMNCRACRMDKCVLAGMDVNSMRLSDPFYKKRVNAFLEQRRHFLLTIANNANSSRICDSNDQTCSPLSPMNTSSRGIFQDNNSEFAYTLDSMSSLEQLLQRFFSVELSFKPGFLEQFPSLRELLAFPESVLGNVHKFMEPWAGTNWSNDQKYEMASKMGTALYNPIPLFMDLMSVIEIFRSMPIFWKLEPEDQIILLNYVAQPILELFNKFSSARRKSPVVLKVANGYNMWHLFCNNGLYANDKIIHKLADQLFRHAMDPFIRIQLTMEEFLLVRAIVICHPATSGLSSHARQVLQREGEKYARMLMQLLQARHGAPACARRFADCMHLAEFAFRAAEKRREFWTYLAMVSEQHRFHATIPPVFLPMCMAGTETEN